MDNRKTFYYPCSNVAKKKFKCLKERFNLNKFCILKLSDYQNKTKKKKRRSEEILRLKYLKSEETRQKNKTKARGELFASSFRNFDSRETHVDLTNQLLANRVTNFAHAR